MVVVRGGGSAERVCVVLCILTVSMREGLRGCSYFYKNSTMRISKKKTTKAIVPKQVNDFVIFTTGKGKVNIDVFFSDETLWLTQKNMAELFDTTVPNIVMHLKNIFKEGELEEKRTIKNFLIVQKEGAREVSRNVDFHNLDAIIAVGYRVNSKMATAFRVWATEVLRDYIIKGFAMDDERLKQGQHFGKDYFEEVLERIREIRASERRFYQKITDLYALSADYNKDADITKEFFATVQNKWWRCCWAVKYFCLGVCPVYSSSSKMVLGRRILRLPSLMNSTLPFWSNFGECPWSSCPFSHPVSFL